MKNGFFAKSFYYIRQILKFRTNRDRFNINEQISPAGSLRSLRVRLVSKDTCVWLCMAERREVSPQLKQDPSASVLELYSHSMSTLKISESGRVGDCPR